MYFRMSRCTALISVDCRTIQFYSMLNLVMVNSVCHGNAVCGFLSPISDQLTS